MTYKEAYNHLLKGTGGGEAHDIALLALSKQIPKDPHLRGGKESCPRCEFILPIKNQLWCNICGQAIKRGDDL